MLCLMPFWLLWWFVSSGSREEGTWLLTLLTSNWQDMLLVKGHFSHTGQEIQGGKAIVCRERDQGPTNQNLPWQRDPLTMWPQCSPGPLCTPAPPPPPPPVQACCPREAQRTAACSLKPGLLCTQHSACLTSPRSQQIPTSYRKQMKGC